MLHILKSVLPFASLLLQNPASLLLNVFLPPPQLASFGFLVSVFPILQKSVSIFQEKMILFLPRFPVHHPKKTMKTCLLITKGNAANHPDGFDVIFMKKKITMTNERHFASLRDRRCSSYLILLSSSYLTLSFSSRSFSRSSKFFFMLPDVLCDLTGTTVTSSESSPS